MHYDIIFAPEAKVDFKRLSARHRAILLDGIERHLRYELDKESKCRIKRLRRLSHPQYRLRREGFRIFYDILEQDVEVLAIVPKALAARWLAEWGEEE
jgi:mRNA-degrading endonuclease RelE of RelBE toxin-antitoxin system